MDDIDIDAVIASAPSDDPTHVIDATSPLSRDLDLSERGLTGTELALERGSVTTATNSWFFAAERSIEGPQMSICSIASCSCTPSRHTVISNG